jgi:serine/threonine protein kinase
VVQADSQPAKASELLEGLQLDDGWQVVRRMRRTPGSTGGTFSTPYLVERDGPGGTVVVAFLKALDFSLATGMGMPIADALQQLTSAYVFERDLVLRCAERRMSSVITGLGAGQVRVTHESVNPFLAEVPYIIFEQADGGDVRSQLVGSFGVLDEAWTYRVCHGAANGIRQLHQAGISHQDLKPSNVMSVGRASKLGDLGRAAMRDRTGVFDGHLFAGDINYAPPECLYQQADSDRWKRVRQHDLYQLGSLLVFLLTGTGMTALLHQKLPPSFHWSTWPNSYQNVLPYVRNAFDDAYIDIGRTIPDKRHEDVLRLVRVLCDPDPAIRGWPASSDSQRLSAERCVSHFDRIARMAEIDIRRSLQ